MKTIFSILILGSLITTAASAQNSSGSEKPSISLDAVTVQTHQAGNLNYLLSTSDQDFKNQKYVFCTDSNATIAYISINGFLLRLTGGPNAEHIMAYTGSGYTVTLSRDKNVSPSSSPAPDDQSNLKIQATLVIYAKNGQAVAKKVIGTQFNAVKK
jgi:hypothetical protein